MAALITKYYAPTNTKSARIMVKGFGRKKVYTWDYSLDMEDNYTNAMTDFINELNKQIQFSPEEKEQAKALIEKFNL